MLLKCAINHFTCTATSRVSSIRGISIMEEYSFTLSMMRLQFLTSKYEINCMIVCSGLPKGSFHHMEQNVMEFCLNSITCSG